MDRIRRLDGENIIVVTNNLAITEELVEENRTTCRGIMQDLTGPVVIVIDYRESKTDFNNILDIRLFCPILAKLEYAIS